MRAIEGAHLLVGEEAIARVEGVGRQLGPRQVLADAAVVVPVVGEGDDDPQAARARRRRARDRAGADRRRASRRAPTRNSWLARAHGGDVASPSPSAQTRPTVRPSLRAAAMVSAARARSSAPCMTLRLAPTNANGWSATTKARAVDAHEGLVGHGAGQRQQQRNEHRRSVAAVQMTVHDSASGPRPRRQAEGCLHSASIREHDGFAHRAHCVMGARSTAVDRWRSRRRWRETGRRRACSSAVRRSGLHARAPARSRCGAPRSGWPAKTRWSCSAIEVVDRPLATRWKRPGWRPACQGTRKPMPTSGTTDAISRRYVCGRQRFAVDGEHDLGGREQPARQAPLDERGDDGARRQQRRPRPRRGTDRRSRPRGSARP